MTDTVTVTARVTYRAWPVPSHAVLDMPPQPKQAGLTELPKIAVEELDPHVLDALATQWLDHLYASVGRQHPFRRPAA